MYPFDHTEFHEAKIVNWNNKFVTALDSKSGQEIAIYPQFEQRLWVYDGIIRSQPCNNGVIKLPPPGQLILTGQDHVLDDERYSLEWIRKPLFDEVWLDWFELTCLNSIQFLVFPKKKRRKNT